MPLGDFYEYDQLSNALSQTIAVPRNLPNERALVMLYFLTGPFLLRYRVPVESGDKER